MEGGIVQHPVQPRMADIALYLNSVAMSLTSFVKRFSALKAPFGAFFHYGSLKIKLYFILLYFTLHG